MRAISNINFKVSEDQSFTYDVAFTSSILSTNFFNDELIIELKGVMACTDTFVHASFMFELEHSDIKEWEEYLGDKYSDWEEYLCMWFKYLYLPIIKNVHLS